ncbi:unnamed protein product [Cuscuta campestris]|uniref:Chitin-binding type-1 domain-containing protein n=1 Tax=Cuscuta campestris TaxID=132261 RepID=A0A484MXR6_9ASTE|nr:unnamed protein product [Cuscuta campestris]
MKLSSSSSTLVIGMVLAMLLTATLAQNCGSQAGGRTCAGNHCCSRWGYCGLTCAHCGGGCQSNCHPDCGPVKFDNETDVVVNAKP